MKAVLEETEGNITMSKGGMSNIEMPSFLNRTMGKVTMKIGLEEKDLSEWDKLGKTIQIDFNHVSDNLKWDDLFPERIDELEENDFPTCPQIPMPDF
ncbi:hypothetical protein C1H46_008336 [Malus baccata]|uniref:Uncharacterized protein n=1 Tax=Malus baccata TaxID=106549 RepID=A0A540N4P1_MALBA|nr:hypothetical protein C1H46_008336 [Malus baccata]